MLTSTQKECFESLSIGGRLKAERERLKLSQQQAADFAEVRREMWGKYERGAAIPSISVIEHFCAHGADALYLVTGNRPSGAGSGQPLDAPIHDREAVRLAIQELQSWQVREQRFLSPEKFAEAVFTLCELAEDKPERVKPAAAVVLRLVA